jgi:carboxymethylenebutenolidase
MPMGEMIKYVHSDVNAYEAEAVGEPRGAVIVIQEIWGLVDHIRDVTDRFAAQGYLAVAPDLLGHVDLTPFDGQELQELMSSPDEQTRLAAQPRLRALTDPARTPEFAEWAVIALRDVVDGVLDRIGTRGRVAVVGFCFGGTYAWSLALHEPRLRAAVPFYGRFPEGGDPSAIRCPVLAFYGEEDHGITDEVPELERRMRDAGVDFTARVYHGVGHAFFNDSRRTVYDREAAEDAWQRTLAFIDKAFTNTP